MTEFTFSQVGQSGGVARAVSSEDDNDQVIAAEEKVYRKRNIIKRLFCPRIRYRRLESTDTLAATTMANHGHSNDDVRFHDTNPCTETSGKRGDRSKRFRLRDKNHHKQSKNSTKDTTIKPRTRKDHHPACSSFCACNDEGLESSVNGLLRRFLFHFTSAKSQNRFISGIMCDEDHYDDVHSEKDDCLSQKLQPLYKANSSCTVYRQSSDYSCSFDDDMHIDTSATTSTTSLQSPSSFLSSHRRHCSTTSTLSFHEDDNIHHVIVYSEECRQAQDKKETRKHTTLLGELQPDQTLQEENNQEAAGTSDRIIDQQNRPIQTHSAGNNFKEEKKDGQDKNEMEGITIHLDGGSKATSNRNGAVHEKQIRSQYVQPGEAHDESEGHEVIGLFDADEDNQQVRYLRFNRDTSTYVSSSSNYSASSNNSISIVEDILPDTLFATAWDFYNDRDAEQEETSSVSTGDSVSLLNGLTILEEAAERVQMSYCPRQTKSVQRNSNISEEVSEYKRPLDASKYPVKALHSDIIPLLVRSSNVCSSDRLLSPLSLPLASSCSATIQSTSFKSLSPADSVSENIVSTIQTPPSALNCDGSSRPISTSRSKSQTVRKQVDRKDSKLGTTLNDQKLEMANVGNRQILKPDFDGDLITQPAQGRNKPSAQKKAHLSYSCSAFCDAALDPCQGLDHRRKEGGADEVVGNRSSSSLVPSTLQAVAESQQQATATALLNNLNLFETVQELAHDGSFIMKHFLLHQQMEKIWQK